MLEFLNLLTGLGMIILLTCLGMMSDAPEGVDTPGWTPVLLFEPLL